MALLAMTGVFSKSLANIARIDLGLDVESVVMFSISPEASGYSPQASAALFDRLEQELGAIPGATSAASSMIPLLGGGGFTINQTTALNYVSPDFFRTLGIEMLRGREFADADAAGAPAVAIVNQRYAERLGPGENILGQRIPFGPTEIEIVGVVADAKYDEVIREIGPQLLLPRRQRTTLGPQPSMFAANSRPRSS